MMTVVPQTQEIRMWIDEAEQLAPSATVSNAVSYPLPPKKKPKERDPMTAEQRDERRARNRRERRARGRNRNG
jgi:hypothetical protein